MQEKEGGKQAYSFQERVKLRETVGKEFHQFHDPQNLVLSIYMQSVPISPQVPALEHLVLTSEV